MREKEELEKELNEINDDNQDLKDKKRRSIDKIKENAREITKKFLQERGMKWIEMSEVQATIIVSALVAERGKKELEKLVSNAKNKLGEESEFILKILLKVQMDIIKSADNSLKKSLENLQDSLSKKLNKKEIEEICQKQKEVVQLEEVIKTLGKEEELVTQVENLVELEELGRIKKPIEDIEILSNLKKILNAVLEVSKENTELKEQLLELRAEINELLADERIIRIKIIKKTANFLNTKRTLITIRQGTITRLKDCCNELETYINERYSKFSEAGNMISAIGTALSISPAEAGNPVKAAGEIIISINNSYKRNFSAKCSEEFQEHLENDKDSLLCFNKSFGYLISTIQESKEQEIISAIVSILKLEDKLESTEIKSLSADYEVFDVTNNI
ncbi:1306_t:CDS:2 [Ambispora gerdemannii]|uniref:1306_t:CDS:1 n=1 Tax=Ambispora gerdemannii TaxID=144530 RepID=A0A9N9BIL0_9GLOM|nr:1306_t:CDS:2 [Ambispora gerdemannii]